VTEIPIPTKIPQEIRTKNAHNNLGDYDLKMTFLNCHLAVFTVLVHTASMYVSGMSVLSMNVCMY
jgi:hypothetical protein